MDNTLLKIDNIYETSNYTSADVIHKNINEYMDSSSWRASRK